MGRPSDVHAKIDLLRAAEEVFVACGLEKARVEQITDRAGRSKGSFYLHFRTKEDAFRQIVEAMLARLVAIVEESIVAEDAPLEETVAAWQAKDLELFEFVWQNRAVMRLLLSGGGSARFGYLIDEFADRSRQMTQLLLQKGKDRGFYRADLDVAAASLCIAGAYDRLAREVARAERKPDLRHLLESVQALLLRGLASEPLRKLLDPRVSDDPPTSEPDSQRNTNPAPPRPRARRTAVGP